ncbi:hypothetical protein [Aliicoccus persicus]|uniref:Secreted protein n=1 Tax=Aliicoccus persicus TaxID=930138 RepID=A0A662Z1G4_9STAP|nr:hypothetical protein [Aliicoccus persicus]SEV86524.1 hypothetical protein SAMN05192557_0588 [Aliicoccus persicus]
MKKVIQSFLTVFGIVFTISTAFSMMSDQDVASYSYDDTYEQTYADGVFADKVMDIETANAVEQKSNDYDDGYLLADESTNK